MTLPAPKHYWKFDETSGTTAADSAGNATVTLDRGNCWVPGKSGNAVRFDPNGGVRLATTTVSDIPPPWTAACWVKPDAAPAGSAALLSSNYYAFKLQQSNTPGEVGITQFGDKDWSFGIAVPLDEWTYLTLVGTATDTTLYLNGVPKGTLPVSINLGLDWLGSTQGYEEFAKMLLDEVEIFDVALTGDQVGQLVNGPPKSSPPPPPPPWPPTLIFPLQGRWLMTCDPGITTDRYYYDVTDTGDGHFTSTGTNIRTGNSAGCPAINGYYVSATEINGATWNGYLFAENPDTIKWVFAPWTLERPYAVWTRA
ncbi:LamG domain-containing protein [Sorangium sp. So ce367]|uniref:LamG domain-containing protein n=1 Tax=Sorangium sp. So ce367 TaxID=3133305 RepID=UPI003F5E9EAF